MLQSYNTQYKRTKRIMAMFSTYPLVGLLNVAVSHLYYCACFMILLVSLVVDLKNLAVFWLIF